VIPYGCSVAKFQVRRLGAKAMPRSYGYVGPREIAVRAAACPPGTVVASAGDIIAWARATGPGDGRITATFVVDTAGRLRLADRHSEHVACAGGGPVLAAGELTLYSRAGRVSVEEISNQSTGYCPEPDSWMAVATALAEAGVPAPEGYTTELLFRRCPGCGQINVVKDSAFECAVCGSALPSSWNLEAVADD
jgi:hypothetical protein